MSSNQLKGTGVALVTPFKHGVVDLDALKRIIHFVMEGGIDYLVCLGTTGESATLTRAESRSVLDTFVTTSAGHVPIVLGALGGNDTAGIIRQFSEFDLSGVSALLSSSPAYNKPSQEGIFEHYRALADQSPLPIIIYNVPARTCSNISADTTLRIAEECDQIIGIKDAAGDMMQAAMVIKNKPEDFLILSGDDPTALSMMALGADGVISVIANAFPARLSQMVEASLAGDFDRAVQLHFALLDIHYWLYAEGNPTGIKGAMEILGLCGREMRLPLMPLSTERYEGLKLAMDYVG
ncbi:MAG: 4-hydroxy-tetrahydrodipicolinate synthase [Saprospiraceae bacterium]|nr:4-hydroxy-tetrahydrodipicolinate synthase [Saprospiraceae bacterium]